MLRSDGWCVLEREIRIRPLCESFTWFNADTGSLGGVIPDRCSGISSALALGGNERTNFEVGRRLPKLFPISRRLSNSRWSKRNVVFRVFPYRSLPSLFVFPFFFFFFWKRSRLWVCSTCGYSVLNAMYVTATYSVSCSVVYIVVYVSSRLLHNAIVIPFERELQ